MSRLPYANLDRLRQAIKECRLVCFQCKGSSFTGEPHCLGVSPRYGAFIVGMWVKGEERFDFFRYAEMRKLEVLDETFDVVRAEFNLHDRRLGGIDTCVPKWMAAKQYA